MAIKDEGVQVTDFTIKAINEMREKILKEAGKRLKTDILFANMMLKKASDKKEKNK